jgi:hypothetical protein
MNKSKVVIASILKPVDDTRMFEKLAISMSQTNKYDINIIGFSSKNISSAPNISFFPLFSFKRNQVKRWASSWKIYKKLLQLKPEVTIVSSPEILIVTCIYKILFGTKILYDVQENYYRNILFTNTYPKLLRLPLALSVRAIEILTRPFIAHYLLAEKNYEKEFNFTKGKSTVLENKFQPIFPIKRQPKQKTGTVKLLYSGTIAENYGIFEAIRFAKKISNTSDTKIRLTIIGFCANSNTLKKVKTEIKDWENIELIGGDTLVPHKQIIQHIAKSDFGLICYHPNKSTINCFPTKIYEYMALELPMIMADDSPWLASCKALKASIGVNFSSLDPETTLGYMQNTAFYPEGAPKEAFWQSEKGKFLTIMESITGSKNQ